MRREWGVLRKSWGSPVSVPTRTRKPRLGRLGVFTPVSGTPPCRPPPARRYLGGWAGRAGGRVAVVGVTHNEASTAHWLFALADRRYSESLLFPCSGARTRWYSVVLSSVTPALPSLIAGTRHAGTYNRLRLPHISYQDDHMFCLLCLGPKVCPFR